MYEQNQYKSNTFFSGMHTEINHYLLAANV